MARSKRDIREEEIEAAAYRLLEERGFAGTGMQAIAQAAHASNETLYRWYGDKTGLYRALITRNARLIVEQIARHLGLLPGSTGAETVTSLANELKRTVIATLGPDGAVAATGFRSGTPSGR